MNLSALLQTLQSATTAAEAATLRQQIEQEINALIDTDFNRLVQLLYSIDVDEQQLKAALRQQTDIDAAHLIAGMLITRLKEKAASRTHVKPPDITDGEERW